MSQKESQKERPAYIQIESGRQENPCETRPKVSNQLNRELKSSKKAKLKQTPLEVENNVKLLHEKEGERVVESIKTNPKTFYKSTKDSTTVQYKIGLLFYLNGSLTEAPKG